jgi:hypothetical protein
MGWDAFRSGATTADADSMGSLLYRFNQSASENAGATCDQDLHGAEKVCTSGLPNARTGGTCGDDHGAGDVESRATRRMARPPGNPRTPRTACDV